MSNFANSLSRCPRVKVDGASAARRVLCFADFRLTSWKLCWSLVITERLSRISNQRKRVSYSGEEQVAILRAHFVEGQPVSGGEVRSKERGHCRTAAGAYAA